MTDADAILTTGHIGELWRFTPAQLSAIQPTLRALPLDVSQTRASLGALFAERGRLADMPAIIARLRAIAFPAARPEPVRDQRPDDDSIEIAAHNARTASWLAQMSHEEFERARSRMVATPLIGPSFAARSREQVAASPFARGMLWASEHQEPKR